MISENLREVRQEIQKSCALVARPETSVTLIGVSKNATVEETRTLVNAGVTHLGENRADKFLLKKQALADIPEITWHFIGNLQRRKVKSIVDEIDYLHSLESLSVAEEIQKRAQKELKCFVEVNVSGESSKQGLSVVEVVPFVTALSGYDKIKVVGLMTMAPMASSVKEQHQIFCQLENLRAEIQKLALPQAPCNELSMGMSNDYPVAIEEGATFIRVGTALFKE
ncbi:YggS family pyridoxal phosphate-dependent enzyme [Enterococcus asini]|uniref:YggS family pyridoxal phosphate-dependent enzyme n=1 Tax=Enterococcus asini TaxID=57732 RepID=UPI00288F86E4|nr:YggS family pyridoxal phosphate-dependent enzyme [Enterococcus asini]MDT2756442.1 YggS family pyridoxal phosphate-dependent enzyme [Enterococcus asini]